MKKAKPVLTLEQQLHRSNWRRVSLLAGLVLSVNALGWTLHKELPERTRAALTIEEQKKALAILDSNLLSSLKNEKALTSRIMEEVKKNEKTSLLYKQALDSATKHTAEKGFLATKLNEAHKDVEKYKEFVIAKDREIAKLKEELKAKPKERIVYKDKIVYRDKAPVTPKVNAPSHARKYTKGGGSTVTGWVSNGNFKVNYGSTSLSYAPIVNATYCSSLSKSYEAYRAPEGQLVVKSVDGATLTFWGSGTITSKNICDNAVIEKTYYRQ